MLPRFPVLRHRNFRLYVVGQGLSLVGFWMQSVAQGWLVYRLSGSAFALGVVAFAAYAPVLAPRVAPRREPEPGRHRADARRREQQPVPARPDVEHLAREDGQQDDPREAEAADDAEEE